MEYAFVRFGTTDYIDRSDGWYYNLRTGEAWEPATATNPVLMDHLVPDTLLILLEVPLGN